MIQRDGASTSIWQNTVEAYKTVNASTQSHYDVVIVGGGITGVSTALELQKAGQRCLLLEANSLCFGTTGGTTAHLNTLLDTPYYEISSDFGKVEAQQVAESVKEAIALIKSNIETYSIDCGFKEATAYLFSQNSQQDKELEKIATGTTDAGVANDYTNKIPVPIAFTKAICIGGQAQFIPTKYVFALAQAFEAAGGIILQNCRVTGAEEKKHIEVETGAGLFTCEALVYATHIPPAINLLHLRCMPYRSYAMAVTLSDDKYPDGLVYNLYDPYNYYRTQEINGKRYLIGGGYDHKTAHEDDTKDCFKQLEAHMRGNFKVKEIINKWSSQFFESADGLPYIGKLPGHSGKVFVATGYGGNGMTYSHVAALLLTNMLLDRKTPYTEIYNPGRVKPVAGFVNFLKHNADVVKQFAGKWLPHEELKNLADLSDDEGKVVKYKDEKVALYKDAVGVIHAISPICTHMKCEVKWNTAEKSWDCPCHGARYSADGKVLTGPADRDLEKIEVKSLVEH